MSTNQPAPTVRELTDDEIMSIYSEGPLYHAPMHELRDTGRGDGMTSHTPGGHPVAVDRTYYYQPMVSCPRGQKVTLLTQYGVATHGQFDGKDPQFIGWSPLPKVPDEMKGLMK